MKYKINKAAFDALSDDLKALYKQFGDYYMLSIEGMPSGDPDGLAEKNEQLLTELKQMKAKAGEEEEAKRKAEEEAAKKKGDIEALEKSWQEKLDKANSESQQKLDALQGSLDGLLVDNVAQKLASEIGVKGSESLLIPHITQRLAAEERDGKHTTVIKDVNGQASALTLDELKNEFIANPAFAPVVVGSKANGGGAGGGNGGAAGGGDKKPEDYTEAERVTLHRENPDLFKQLFSN